MATTKFADLTATKVTKNDDVKWEVLYTPYIGGHPSKTQKLYRSAVAMFDIGQIRKPLEKFGFDFESNWEWKDGAIWITTEEVEELTPDYENAATVPVYGQDGVFNNVPWCDLPTQEPKVELFKNEAEINSFLDGRVVDLEAADKIYQGDDFQPYCNINADAGFYTNMSTPTPTNYNPHCELPLVMGQWLEDKMNTKLVNEGLFKKTPVWLIWIKPEKLPKTDCYVRGGNAQGNTPEEALQAFNLRWHFNLTLDDVTIEKV